MLAANQQAISGGQGHCSKRGKFDIKSAYNIFAA
jgi:hypothetical protein